LFGCICSIIDKILLYLGFFGGFGGFGGFGAFGGAAFL
jgi:hypothetical protein